jgi:CheY-like chemotaxis protein
MAAKKLLVVDDDHTELVIGMSNQAQPQTNKREKAAGRSPLLADTAKGGSSSKSNPAHILLVEDREIDQKVATGFLKVWGYKVDLAVNGREAIEMLAKKDYDLMLIDIQMPEMDGLTATAAIRKAETTRRLPIIALTARAMKGDRELCIAAGMDGYLTKPIRFKTFRAVLDSHLRTRKN